MISTMDTSVTHYEIVNGQLQTWEDGDCSKIIFTGNSTTAQGTWTTDFTTTPTNDPNCNDEDNIQEILPYLNDAVGTAVMPQFGGTPTCPEENPFDDPQMQACLMQYIVENGCFADMMLQGLGDTDGITKIDCNTIQMIDPESGQTTTIQMTPAIGGVNVTLTVGNCSTSFFQSYEDIGDEPTIEDPEFTACIMDQQQPMALLKQTIPKIAWPSLD